MKQLLKITGLVTWAALDPACVPPLPHLCMLSSGSEKSCLVPQHACRALISSSVSHDTRIPDDLSADFIFFFEELNVAYPDSGCFSLMLLGSPQGWVGI